MNWPFPVSWRARPDLNMVNDGQCRHILTNVQALVFQVIKRAPHVCFTSSNSNRSENNSLQNPCAQNLREPDQKPEYHQEPFNDLIYL